MHISLVSALVHSDVLQFAIYLCNVNHKGYYEQRNRVTQIEHR